MRQFIDTSLHPLFGQLSELIGLGVKYVWYYPVVFLCIYCGIMFTLRSGFIQFRGIRHTIDLIRGKYDNPNEPGQITHFQALMAALSGTIGLKHCRRCDCNFSRWPRNDILDVDCRSIRDGNKVLRMHIRNKIPSD